MLPKQAIDEFKQIYLKDKGVLLTDKQATEEAQVFFDGLKILIDNQLPKVDSESMPTV
jgi:hypothetical protein